jgi:hypothetical protein
VGSMLGSENPIYELKVSYRPHESLCVQILLNFWPQMWEDYASDPIYDAEARGVAAKCYLGSLPRCDEGPFS